MLAQNNFEMFLGIRVPRDGNVGGGGGGGMGHHHHHHHHTNSLSKEMMFPSDVFWYQCYKNNL